MNKKFLLEESKVFCMFPWVHLNVTPYGNVYPCCSSDYTSPIGNVKTHTLKEIFNNDQMKNLRLDMLFEKENSFCKFCYQHEKSGSSFRKYANEQFGKYFDDIVPTTDNKGAVDKFKMRYMDIRFNNICNFKCRTCGSEFSSQWAKEDKKHNPNIKIFQHARDDEQLLNEVLEHLDHVDLIYFGGGEPLLMTEHYVLLDAILKKKRNDIRLRYNTNASTLKFKNKDVLEIWKKFNNVEVSVSLDHYGEKAEYIRHGTNWAEVENNLNEIRKIHTVTFSINTVLSIFNYLTLNEFYSYLIDKNILRKNDHHNTLYHLLFPKHYSSQSMPLMLKNLAREKNLNLYERLKNLEFSRPEFIKDAIDFSETDNLWNDEMKEKFKYEIFNRDKIRNESFLNVFPELSTLYD